MKYMELPELSMLSRMLTHNSNECTVHTRLEAYSCKATTKDKRMLRHLEHNYHVEELAGSPPYLGQEREAEITAFGPMDNYTTRKTLYLLIGTLNHAFPDHDFSDLRPDNFSREASGAPILNALSTTLISINNGGGGVEGPSSARSYSAYPPSKPDIFPSSLPTSSSPVSRIISSFTPPEIVSGTHPTLYKLLDDIIKLDESELYSYTPDMQSDPHATDSDDEEEMWDSDETSSVGSDDGGVFEFDDDDDDEPTTMVDRISTRPLRVRTSSPKPIFPSSENTSPDSLSASPVRSRPRTFMRKPHGGLLWSTHSFFHNRKLKRILYVTTWARKKVGKSMTTSSQDMEGFKAWEGAIGAGARAFGLKSDLARRSSVPSF